MNPVFMPKDRLAKLEGLIPESVGLRLAQLAKFVHPDECIVDIGCYKGKSTCYLAAGSSQGLHAPVYAIDPWDLEGNQPGRHGFDEPSTRLEFQRQVSLAGYSSDVTAFRSFSVEMAERWTRPVGLLYVDGSHALYDVDRDWEAWKLHLAPKAIVVFCEFRASRYPAVESVVNWLVRVKTFDQTDELTPPLFIGWMP